MTRVRSTNDRTRIGRLQRTPAQAMMTEDDLRALSDFGTTERLQALDKIERLLRKAERDARLLDGRDYRHRPFAEAYRLLDLLRENEERRTGGAR